VSETGVRDNSAESRYELLVNGLVRGTLNYRAGPESITLVHTEVDPELEGRGLGSRLVRDALEDIRGRGLRVVPVCPFVTSYLERHPELADVVAPAEPG
jgi:predicted GNAT family acetyltransferase